MSDPRVAIFLHSGDYDRVHQGLAIAAAAVAAGREVHLFFFWWALDRLLRDDLEEPSFDDPRVPQESREAAEDAFENGYPTAAQLLDNVRKSGRCTIYACSASSGLLGRRPDAVAEKVDRIVGWSAILSLTAGITDRFYL
ncbi:MAG TPA: hypothetical protein VKY51_06105 [Fredinandcohnia sp.]|nr:hypothetical protein [Fredinandcohnia sp.]